MPTFLDGRPYTRLRGAAMLYFVETGHVVTPSNVSDSGGGANVTWTQDTTDIPCRVQAFSGNEGLVAGRIKPESTYSIAIPKGWAPVDTIDRFQVNDRGTFAITAAADSTRETFLILEAVEL